jgi:hypothetical protein
MAPTNLPPIFNATSQDIEMLLAAQCHLGSKNLQVHMEPYLWKTRPDGINVLNIGKTWLVHLNNTFRGGQGLYTLTIHIKGENRTGSENHCGDRQSGGHCCHLRSPLRAEGRP